MKLRNQPYAPKWEREGKRYSLLFADWAFKDLEVTNILVCFLWGCSNVTRWGVDLCSSPKKF
jgi:hypothetical protein